MADTTKQKTALDQGQAIRQSFNDVDASLTMADSWCTGVVGRKKTYVISTTTVSNDTVTVTYSEGANTLFAIQYIYTNGTRDVLVSEERIS